MNVDAEIYIKQVFHFFDTNPDQLETLIGQLSKEKFYERIISKVYEHVDSGSQELELTRQEMVDIIRDLYTETLSPTKIIKSPFVETRFGLVCLN